MADRNRDRTGTTTADLERQGRAAAHPDRPGERCAAPSGAWRPVVDHRECEAKRDCVAVCPHAVFEVTEITGDDFDRLGMLGRLRSRAHRRQTSYAVRADACRACGLCVVACPEGAITLVGPVRNRNERTEP